MNGPGLMMALLMAASIVAPAQQSAEHAFENRWWRIAKYRASGGDKTDQQDMIDTAKSAGIKFANGQIDGSPTCGGLYGTYRVSGNQLTVHAHLMLRGFCPDEMMAQNQQVLNALNGDFRVEGKNDQIVLRDKSGQVRVLLVAR